MDTSHRPRFEQAAFHAWIERNGNWREQVGPNDTLWHLSETGPRWRLLAALPGRKHLILAHAADRTAAIRNSGIFETIAETHRLSSPAGELLLIHNPGRVLPSEPAAVIHGRHHYDPQSLVANPICVEHTTWAPIDLDVLTRQVRAARECV